MQEFSVAVIGAGPAGMMAAGTAAGQGCQTILIEKNDQVGQKLRLTGKGRCNLTNQAEVESLIENVVSNPRFLYSAFYSFTSQDLRRFFRKLGLETRVTRGNRVFPVTEDAEDVVVALKRYLKDSGVQLRRGQVTGIKAEAGSSKLIKLADGDKLQAKSVVIATGGDSYPWTGSTGEGYRFARRLGHTIIKPRPALSPLDTREDWVAETDHLDLRNVSLTVFEGEEVMFEGLGELSFTDRGVGGPLVLSASSFMDDPCSQEYKIIIDLKPGLSFEELDQRVQRDFKKYSRKYFSNSLGDLLPVKLIPVIVKLAPIPCSRPVHQITRKHRRELVNLLKNLELRVKDYRSLSGALVTAGGVCVDEVDPSTMESKLTKGVYLAGEVLDVDALTGGYNLQIAFSTGYLAGLNAGSGNK